MTTPYMCVYMRSARTHAHEMFAHVCTSWMDHTCAHHGWTTSVHIMDGPHVHVLMCSHTFTKASSISVHFSSCTTQQIQILIHTTHQPTQTSTSSNPNPAMKMTRCDCKYEGTINVTITPSMCQHHLHHTTITHPNHHTTLPGTLAGGWSVFWSCLSPSYASGTPDLTSE